MAAGYWLWAAIRAVKSKTGLARAFEAIREVDGSITEADWQSAVGQARAALANRLAEVTRPLNRRPVTGEWLPMDTKRQTGFLQHVDVWVRDRDTGLIEARPYTIRGSTLRSRQSVVNEARDRFQGAIDSEPDDYPEDIVAVQYTGTYEMIVKG